MPNKGGGAMKMSEQTYRQVERAIKKIADKCAAGIYQDSITDIHLRIYQDSGELIAFDDDDNEITRCVVEEWIDNKDDGFYHDVARILRCVLDDMKTVVDHLDILKPYSFVLEDDDRETVAELYVADDDTVILGGGLMPGLENELDDFFDHLLKEGETKP